MINRNVSDLLVNKNSFSSPNVYQFYQRSEYKQYPFYISELKNYPPDNPILIAVDKASSNYIRRLNGICLLCERSYEHYELSFCYQREVWVLYSRVDNFVDAMNFAHAIAQLGANKIYVTLVRL